MPGRPEEIRDNQRVPTVLPERTEDGATDKPSMTVDLIEIDRGEAAVRLRRRPRGACR
jgi:hypothetical protein